MLFNHEKGASYFFTDKCITVDGADNGTTCVFPFRYSGLTYKACTMKSDVRPWCSTLIDDDGVHVPGQGKWGYCDPDCPCDDRCTKVNAQCTECPLIESDEGKPEQICSPI